MSVNTSDSQTPQPAPAATPITLSASRNKTIKTVQVLRFTFAVIGAIVCMVISYNFAKQYVDTIDHVPHPDLMVNAFGGCGLIIGADIPILIGTVVLMCITPRRDYVHNAKDAVVHGAKLHTSRLLFISSALVTLSSMIVVMSVLLNILNSLSYTQH